MLSGETVCDKPVSRRAGVVPCATPAPQYTRGNAHGSVTGASRLTRTSTGRATGSEMTAYDRNPGASQILPNSIVATYLGSGVSMLSVLEACLISSAVRALLWSEVWSGAPSHSRSLSREFASESFSPATKCVCGGGGWEMRY